MLHACWLLLALVAAVCMRVVSVEARGEADKRRRRWTTSSRSSRQSSPSTSSSFFPLIGSLFFRAQSTMASYDAPPSLAVPAIDATSARWRRASASIDIACSSWTVCCTGRGSRLVGQCHHSSPSTRRTVDCAEIAPTSTPDLSVAVGAIKIADVKPGADLARDDELHSVRDDGKSRARVPADGTMVTRRRRSRENSSPRPTTTSPCAYRFDHRRGEGLRRPAGGHDPEFRRGLVSTKEHGA